MQNFTATFRTLLKIRILSQQILKSHNFYVYFKYYNPDITDFTSAQIQSFTAVITIIFTHPHLSDYGLDDQGSIPDRGRGFFFKPLRPDRLWGPPNLLFNGHRGSFPRGKARPGRDADHSHPSSAEVKNE
jgi:hypothetical protein